MDQRPSSTPQGGPCWRLRSSWGNGNLSDNYAYVNLGSCWSVCAGGYLRRNRRRTRGFVGSRDCVTRTARHGLRHSGRSQRRGRLSVELAGGLSVVRSLGKGRVLVFRGSIFLRSLPHPPLAQVILPSKQRIRLSLRVLKLASGGALPSANSFVGLQVQPQVRPVRANRPPLTEAVSRARWRAVWMRF